MTTAAREGARILVEELVASGVSYAVLAPGSRSAPLALALEEHDGVRLDVTLDERSAAFMALGAARATGEPTAVLTTSGTAAANLFPAIQEAHHGRVPLIALTADRPPELRHTGANQTIDQVKLFGDAVRWFVDIEAPTAANLENDYLRSIASRAVATAAGSPAGPVHLNVALREPLVGPDEEVIDAPSRPPPSNRWTSVDPPVTTLARTNLESALERIRGVERGVIVCGPSSSSRCEAVKLAERLGWPLLADPLSNERRGSVAVSTYDALLRNPGFASRMQPDLVLRVGALGISKALAAWVTTAGQHLLVDGDGWWLDPDRTLDAVLHCDPAWFFGQATGLATPNPGRGWLDAWLEAEHRARVIVDELLDQNPLTEPRLARDLVDAIPPGSNLIVGASMPFRDIEWYSRPRADIRFLGNRGVNGIDGFVGTALGMARTSDKPSFALCGDLTLLHDQNALTIRPQDLDLTFVIPNNNGGGIFSFLPQAALSAPFERLFGTPHGRDLSDLARFHHCEHIRVGDPEEFEAALTDRRGVRFIEVRTERERNVTLHTEIHEAVAAAISDL